MGHAGGSTTVPAEVGGINNRLLRENRGDDLPQPGVTPVSGPPPPSAPPPRVGTGVESVGPDVRRETRPT